MSNNPIAEIVKPTGNGETRAPTSASVDVRPAEAQPGGAVVAAGLEGLVVDKGPDGALQDLAEKASVRGEGDGNTPTEQVDTPAQSLAGESAVAAGVAEPAAAETSAELTPMQEAQQQAIAYFTEELNSWREPNQPFTEEQLRNLDVDWNIAQFQQYIQEAKAENFFGPVKIIGTDNGRPREYEGVSIYDGFKDRAKALAANAEQLKNDPALSAESQRQSEAAQQLFEVVDRIRPTITVEPAAVPESPPPSPDEEPVDDEEEDEEIDDEEEIEEDEEEAEEPDAAIEAKVDALTKLVEAQNKQMDELNARATEQDKTIQALMQIQDVTLKNNQDIFAEMAKLLKEKDSQDTNYLFELIAIAGLIASAYINGVLNAATEGKFNMAHFWEFLQKEATDVQKEYLKKRFGIKDEDEKDDVEEEEPVVTPTVTPAIPTVTPPASASPAAAATPATP